MAGKVGFGELDNGVEWNVYRLVTVYDDKVLLLLELEYIKSHHYITIV